MTHSVGDKYSICCTCENGRKIPTNAILEASEWSQEAAAWGKSRTSALSSGRKPSFKGQNYSSVLQAYSALFESGIGQPFIR